MTRSITYSCAYVAVTFLRMRADGAMTDTISSALANCAMVMFFVMVAAWVALYEATWAAAVDPTLGTIYKPA